MKRRKPSRCLRVESLEARLNMAAFTVTASTDVVNAADDATVFTLREAINAANANGGTDTITFANGISTISLTIGELVLTDSAKTTISDDGVIVERASDASSFRVFRVVSGADAEINGLTIQNGVEDFGGGGIYNDGTLTVTNSTLSGNSADGDGGGIYNDGTLTVTNSTLSGNSADFGGGISNTGTLTVTNSTLSGNISPNLGGGISNSGSLTVTNSMLTGNRADSDGNGFGGGGGIYTYSFTGISTTLFNTIVAGNFVGTGTTANDLAEKNVETTSSNNLIGHAGSAGGLVNNTNGNKVGFAVATVLNPTLASNGGPTLTHALVVNSPAINAGNNANIPSGVTTDQRGTGFSRIVGGTVDIGALEFMLPAGPYQVDLATDEDDGNYSPGNLSLREAINAANANPGTDTITFAPAIAGGTITLSSRLVLTDSVTISGPANRVTLDGNNATRLLLVNSGVTASLANLILTRGIDDTDFVGPIYNDGTLNLTQVEVVNNTSRGSIYSSGTSTLNVQQSRFSGNNSASSVSAILADGATVTIASTTFSNNSNSAVFTSGPTNISGSTFSGNTGQNAGAIRHRAGNLTIVNSTFSGNASTGNGGAITTQDGTLTVIHSTFTQNRADSDGNNSGTGGAYQLLASGTGTAVFHNSIFAGNFIGTGTTASEFAGRNVSPTSSFNLIGDAGTAGGLTHNSNGNLVGVNVNTVLNPTLAYNGGTITQTHALTFGSPAVNAGSNTTTTNEGLNFDQRGVTRILQTTVDIGAVESNFPTSLQVDLATDEDDGNYATGDLSLREAIRLANENPAADTITFANGISTISLTNGELVLTDSAKTTISDDGVIVERDSGAFGIFRVVSGADAEINGLTIRNGVDSDGGGISNFGTLTVTHSTLTGNTSFSNGGGIQNSGTLTVTNSTLSGNSSLIFGGGISNSGTLTVTNSTLSGNSVNDHGGGISNFGTLTVTNSTLSGNSANVYGGGIYNNRSLTVTNSTLTGNRADSDGNSFGGGGGIYTDSFIAATTLFNTIVAGNFVGTGTTASDLANKNVETTSTNNLIGDAGSAGGLANNTNGNKVGFAVASVLNPTLANNGGPTLTHALVANSPAINAGNNANIPSGVTTDQRGAGFPRINGGTVDIGAVERTNALTSFTLTPNLTQPSTIQPFTITITLAGSLLPTGFVTLYVNGVAGPTTSLTFGQAQITLPSLPLGQNALFARYTGDANYAAVDSATLTQTGYHASDVNRDNLIDVQDILAVIFYFNTYINQIPIAVNNLPAGPPFVDATGDSQLDIQDILQVIFDFNQAIGSPEGEAEEVSSPPQAVSVTPSAEQVDRLLTQEWDWLALEPLGKKSKRSA